MHKRVKVKTQYNKTPLIVCLLSIAFLLTWTPYVAASYLHQQLSAAIPGKVETGLGTLTYGVILADGPIFIASILVCVAAIHALRAGRLISVEKYFATLIGVLAGIALGTAVWWQVIGYFIRNS